MQNGNRSADYYRILAAVLALVVFGLVMVSSVSVYPSNRITSLMVRMGKLDEPNNHFYLVRSMGSVAVALAVLFAAARIPYRVFERHARRVFGAAVALLVLVLLFGQKYNGTTGWINVPFLPFLLQPAEFLKVAAIVYFAHFLKARRAVLPDLRQGFVPFLAVMAAFVVPLALQPDFGTVLILAPVSALMFFLAGGNIRHLGLLVAACAVLGGGVYALGRHHGPDDRNKLSYVTDRVDNFFASNREAIKNRTINYQTEQGLVAIGSGGFWGLGFGKSVQKYGYLPEVQGDFVFSVVAEELGFVGVCALVGAYLFLAWRGLAVSRRCQEPFARLLSAGVSVWVFTQAYVNMGVNLNVVPLTGVTLPFVSYGGSSLVALALAAGMLLNVAKESPEPAAYLSRRAV